MTYIVYNTYDTSLIIFIDLTDYRTVVVKATGRFTDFASKV